ncbi:MAG: RNA polymerase sigma factor [Planctomycetota bacterium]|jgi:RNA polymerase sigma-70 factor (ECF subfamily)
MEDHLNRVDELSRLAEAVRNGHPERLDDLLCESAGIVHALARSRLGDSLAAEEAVADTLVRVARGIRSLEDSSCYVRWLARIATRCAADASRRRADVVAPAPEEPADPTGGPLEAARAAERAGAIRRAVAGLPKRLRAPVLLHFVEGMSYRDVAEALGKSLSTVSRRMRKALTVLRRRLGEEP